jgi:putative serine/threonine protein kinase
MIDVESPLRSPEIAPLERLAEEQYRKVLCYPRWDAGTLRRRIAELEELGVQAVEFTGEKTAFDVPVLGKGYVGIVVLAHTSKGKVALKVRRVDADRNGMEREAEMLERANAAGVGPRLFDVTENFLVMEFIDGRLLPHWIEEVKGRGAKAKIRKVLRAVLEQCWRLDEAGLDHGQLSRAPKHILIDGADAPHIVDFETASVSRRVSNVSAICQYLFINIQVAKRVSKRLGEINRTGLIAALRGYKEQPSQKTFAEILSICRLATS